MKRQRSSRAKSKRCDSLPPRPMSPRLCCSLDVLLLCGALAIAAPAFAAKPGTVLPPGMVPVPLNGSNGKPIASGIDPNIVTTAKGNGNLMTINQTARSATINWRSFNIGRGSEVNFVQPDSGSQVLNRIWDADPSIIQGKLTANGQVFLLNRNGILFDRGSQVNVNTLLASSLNISDNAFKAGFAVSSTDHPVSAFTTFEDSSWQASLTALLNLKDPSVTAALKAAYPNGIPNALNPGFVKVNVFGPTTDDAGQATADATLIANAPGAIILIAPHIENRGVITATDGQVILAAGEKAYLWMRDTDPVNANSSRASALRGLMVEIHADKGDFNVTSYVRNLGSISADRGNVSIAALAINQDGRVSAGSSAVLNGSVWLTARSVPVQAGPIMAGGDNDVGRPTDQLGDVEFGPGSYTGTPLLVDSGRLAASDSYSDFLATRILADQSTQTNHYDFRSWVHVVGNTIHNQGMIESPGGIIDLLARGPNSRILLDTGSTVTAAGDWVDRQMFDNVISIARLTSNDLADSPLQKAGPLLGSTVQVDVRTGSALFDIGKYAGIQLQTVQDKATVGGVINLEALQGYIVSAPGSTVDVSGGGFRYAGGSYSTTKLIGADGKIYDIGSASPLRRYIGTVNGLTRRYVSGGPSGWDQTITYATRFSAQPTYESGYVQGVSAGTLNVLTPNFVRLGDWFGGVTMGRYQVGLSTRPPGPNDALPNDPTSIAVPRGGELTLGVDDPTSTNNVTNAIRFGPVPTSPETFTMSPTLPAAAAASTNVLPADEFGFAGLQSEIYAYRGFANLLLNSNESITVPRGVDVQLPPGGSFTTHSRDKVIVEGAKDGVAGGSITIPSGQINLSLRPLDKGIEIGGAQYGAAGDVIAAGAALDTSGMVFADARPTTGLPAAGGFTARPGESLSDYLRANLSALLDDMASADARPQAAVAAPRFALDAVSGTEAITNNPLVAITIGDSNDSGRVKFGSGATFSAMGGFRLRSDNGISAGSGGAIALNLIPQSGAAPRLGLYGYSLGKGGSLSLTTRAAHVQSGTGSSGDLGVDSSGGLLFGPGFFQTGGFTSYTLTASRAMDIAPKTRIDPAAEGLQATLSFLNRRDSAVTSGFDAAPAASGDRGVDVTVAGASAATTLAADLNLREKPAGERTATDVSFKLDNAPQGTLTLGAGAEIHADPKANVTFAAKFSGNLPGNGIDLEGKVFAPGGKISATVSSPAPGVNLPFDPSKPDADTQTGLLHIGADAELNSSAAFLPAFGGAAAFGAVRQSDGSIAVERRAQGSVTGGGLITLTANNSRLQLDAGSKLDVSALAATVDLPTDGVGGPYAPRTIWGDAGSINLTATESIWLGGQMIGRSAGSGLGGSFSLNFKPRDAFNVESDRVQLEHRVVLTQGKPADATTDTRLESSISLLCPSPPCAYATARLSAATLNDGGFSSVALKSADSIEFAESVRLGAAQSLTLDAPILDARNGTGSVLLTADRVILANSTGNPTTGNNTLHDGTPVQDIASRLGNATLEADARLIDLIGSVTVKGLRGGVDPAGGRESPSLLLNSSGDIRLTGMQENSALVGALSSEGNIELRARQIYPTSESQFTIASQQVRVTAVDPVKNKVTGSSRSDSGTVRFSQNPGSPQAVLSAGGQLTVKGRHVIQGGTVKAPLGGIELDGGSLTGEGVSFEPGSLTSVSLDGLTVPLGETQNGSSWYYDIVNSGNTAGTFNDETAVTLASPGTKQIVARGAAVAVQGGATLDLSGGGDVQAFEFVPGPGGSKDVLQSSAANKTWAILPSMRLTDAPIDTHLAARGNNAVTSIGSGYNVIYLSGVAGLADGYYPLLDGHYALLPGAYQISALAGGAFANLPVGRVGTLLDGTPIVSAYLGIAGSVIHQATTSGYTIRSGDEAKKFSELNLSNGSFFATQASNNDKAVPSLPSDAGRLTLAPLSSLELAGKVLTKPAAGGLSAEIDISSAKLAVVDGGGDIANLDGYVRIDAGALANLNGSLLLGGERKNDGTLSVTAENVVVANVAAAPLKATEILLAATDTVEVRDKAAIDASVAGSPTRTALATSGDGALLRASADGQLTLARDKTSGTKGTIDVKAGATLVGKSILLDATKTTGFAGSLVQPKGGDLSVASSSVALGDTANVAPANLTGLVLDNVLLAGLADLDSLRIRSYSSINLYGQASVGSTALRTLTLDAREIAGYQARDANGNASAQANTATIAASSVNLLNSGATALAAAPDGTGSLTVNADRILFGEGEKGLRGFGQVTMNAGSEVLQRGVGNTTVAADLTVKTPRLIATTRADQTLRAASYDPGKYFKLEVKSAPTGTAASVSPTRAGPAGRWTLEGKSLSLSTAIDAPAGQVILSARGAGPDDGVTLSGAAVDVGGYRKPFTDTAAYASAGSVTLSAEHGSVVVDKDSLVNVAPDAGGGDAGKVVATAAEGIVAIGGHVSGGGQASIEVDAATISGFSALNDRLGADGVGGERLFRQRQGDLVLDAGTVIGARHVAVSADAGNIDINGTIDASAPTGGGRVELYAGNNLNLNAVSMIRADGTSKGTSAIDPYANGGRVELAAGAGTLNFLSGAEVRVNAGAKGDGGTATFAARRHDAGTLLPMNLAGTVSLWGGARGAAGKVIIRGDRSYGTVGGSPITTITSAITGNAGDGTGTTRLTSSNPVWFDYSRFMDNAGTLQASLMANLRLVTAAGAAPVAAASSSLASVRAGIEIVGTTAAGLTLVDPWDLTDPQWNKNGVPATLTLKTPGTLTIGNSLGLQDTIYDGSADGSNPGFTSVSGDTLPTSGESWSIRLGGGVDASSAAPLAMLSKASLDAAGTGDVILADAGTRDGTGGPLGGGFSGVGRVRTGSGDIDVAAGRNFKMGSANGDLAVLYTAGIPQETANDVDASTGLPLSRYTSGGGNIDIRVQGDATGSMRTADGKGNLNMWGEFVNDWLRRSTSQSFNNYSLGTGGWWVYRPAFHGDIGSFGGGNLSLSVGGSLTNMGVYSPTSGRANWEPETASAIQGDQALVVRGGGDVAVSSGKDIVGGEYLVGLGRGSLRAGDAFGGAVPATLFLMGQGSDPARGGASVRVEAGGDVTVQTISNPTVLAMPGQVTDGSVVYLPNVGFGDTNSTGFFTYASDTAATLLSVAGDIRLGRTAVAKPKGDAALANAYAPLGTLPSFGITDLVSTEGSAAAPPSLSLVAMNGNISASEKQAPIYLYPSSSGRLELLAGGSVTDVNFQATNVVTDNLPQWNRPSIGSAGEGVFGQGAATTTLKGSFTNVRHIVESTYAGVAPRFLVEAQRDVSGDQFSFPDSATVRAGRDVASLVLKLQNLSDAGVSQVVAGRDIVQGNGTLNSNAILVAGPGVAEVQAGRNIDLGTSLGIIANGNKGNPDIATPLSARLVVVSGVKGPLDVATIDALMPGVRLFGTMEDGNSAAMARDATAQIAAALAAGGQSTALLPLAQRFAILAGTGRTFEIRQAAGQALSALMALTMADAKAQPARVLADQLAKLAQTGLDAQSAGALVGQLQSMARGQPVSVLIDDLIRLASGQQEFVGYVSGYVAQSLPANLAAPDRPSWIPTAAKTILAGMVNDLMAMPRSPSARLTKLLDGLASMSTTDTRNGAAVMAEAAAATKALVAAALEGNVTGPGLINMFQSRIQTSGGSSIDLLAPGYDSAGKPAGKVNAGLPTAAQDQTVVGILTQGGGGINGYVSGDFLVNQSKVLTGQGGDIMLYTADGNIDAGRGALTSHNSSPPRQVPIFITDSNGQSVQIGYSFLTPSDLTGSGIRTASSDPDGAGTLLAPPPGSISLFAPKGTINAGEAGIDSAGDLTIRAVQVVNANAISSAGHTSGVPQAETSGVGSLGPAPTPGSPKGGDDPTKTLTSPGSGSGTARPTILLVEVLGFGNCEEGDTRCK